MKLSSSIKKTLNRKKYDDKTRKTLLSFSDEEWKSLADNENLYNYCKLSQLREIYKKLENQEEVDKTNMKLRRLNKKIKELKNG